jgi:hypothetical protein
MFRELVSLEITANYLAKLKVWTSLNISRARHFASPEWMLVYSSDIILLCHKFTINYTMKFIELRVKIQHSQEPARRVQY